MREGDMQESIQGFTRDFLTQLYCFPCESNAAVADWTMKLLHAIRDGAYEWKQ